MDDVVREQTPKEQTPLPEAPKPQETPVAKTPEVDPAALDREMISNLFAEAFASTQKMNGNMQKVNLDDPEEAALMEKRDQDLLGLLEQSLVRENAAGIGITREVRLNLKQEQIVTDKQVLMEAVIREANLGDANREAGLRQDLGRMDLNSFYEQMLFVSALSGKAGMAELLYLEADLGVKLRTAAKERGVAKDAYSQEEVEKIFNALMDEKQVTQFMNVLYQQRLLVALSIDMELGSHFTELIDSIIESDRTPSEKLAMIDNVLSSISKARLKNAKSSENVRSLRRLNRTQDAAQKRAQIRSMERRFGSNIIPLKIAAVGATIAATYPAMPEQDREVFLEEVRLGDGEMIELMLKNGVRKMPDGSYAGEVAGETVFVARSNGVCQAFLKHEGSRIPIEHTEPNAIGFDLALSEKKMMEGGWTELKDRKDIRIAFMEENPMNEMFMNKHQADDFAVTLELILKGKGEHVMKRLKQLGVVYEGGLLRTRYVEGLKRTLRQWAPDGDIARLRGTLGPRTLEALVYLWQQRDRTIEPTLSEYGRIMEISSPLPLLELDEVRKIEKMLPKEGIEEK